MQSLRAMTLLFALTLCSLSTLVAQSPRTISYQGVLTDSLGNPNPDGTYAMTFRLYGAGIGGSALWSETKSLQLKGGLFSTSLGDTNPFPGSLQFDAQYWLSVQVGSNPESSPRMALTSVPYSIVSEKADTARIAGSVAANSITNASIAPNAVTSAKIQDGTLQLVDIGQNGAATGQVIKWNGSTWTAGNDSGGSGGGYWQPNGNNIYYSNGNVGIFTSTPQTRLDLQGGNWDLVNTEGDFRVGNPLYRIKMGVALGGGGAGAASIMQYGQPGGFNALQLGSQGSNLITLHGNTNTVEIANVASSKVGIGSTNPTAKLGISSSGGFSEPQLGLDQVSAGDFARVRFSNGNTGTTTRSWDVAGYIDPGAASGDRLNFFNAGGGGDVLGLSGNGTIYVNANAGTAGQVLTSGGATGAASWQPGNSMRTFFNNTYTTSTLLTPTNLSYVFPNHTYTITVARNSRLIISGNFSYFSVACFACTSTEDYISVRLNGTDIAYLASSNTANGLRTSNSIANFMYDVTPGTYTIDFKAVHYSLSGTDAWVSVVTSSVMVQGL